MDSFLLVMIAGACCGFAGLFLISGDLARRSGLSGEGRVFLAAALGLGVLSVSIKLVIVSILLPVSGNLHPAPLPARPQDATLLPRFAAESAFTAPWRVLRQEDGSGNEDMPDGIVALGKRLFNDPGLSVDGTVACSSCHKAEAGGADRLAVSPGISGLAGTRNAPTVWNTKYLSRFFWDGRAASLEDQARGPLTNPVEMGMPSLAAVEKAVGAKPDYVRAFARIFGSGKVVTIDNVVRAIAAYERTLIAPDTAYDRFVRGDETALTPSQVRGMALFAGIGCRMCHRDPTFSAAGTVRPAGVFKPFPLFSGNEYVQKYDLLSDRGASAAGGDKAAHRIPLWRVPPLRNVENTAPYLHNGSVPSLEEAIRTMAVSQLRWRLTSDHRKEVPPVIWDAKSRTLTLYRPARLTPEDIGDLAEFLRSLSFDTGNGTVVRHLTQGAGSP